MFWLISIYFFVAFSFLSVAYVFYIRLGMDFINYVQAIKAISLNDLNPMVTARGLHIFNDHFDPVIVPVGLLSSVIPPPILGVGVELLMLFLGFMLIHYAYKKKYIDESYALFLLYYGLFSFVVLWAVKRPIHPTVWSAAPIMLITVGLIQKRRFLVLISLVLLLSCKEDFVFSGLVLGGCLLIKKNYRLGSEVLLISFLWACFIFWGRYHLWDNESIHYEKEGFERLLQDSPSSLLAFYMQPAIVWRHVFLFLPLFIFFLFRKGEKSWKKLDYTLLAMAVPLYVTRIAFESEFYFGRHYLPPILFMIIAFLVMNYQPLPLKKSFLWFWLVLMLFSNLESPVLGLFERSSPQSPSLPSQGTAPSSSSQEDPFPLRTRFTIDKAHFYESLKDNIRRNYALIMRRKKEMDESVRFAAEHPNGVIYTSEYYFPYLWRNDAVYWYDFWFYQRDRVALEKAKSLWFQQGLFTQVWRNPSLLNDIGKSNKTQDIVLLSMDPSLFKEEREKIRKMATVVMDTPFVFTSINQRP